mgnify:CR=1 FL=1
MTAADADHTSYGCGRKSELTFFGRPRPNNLIVIKVGRGVGAGIILNGQLFQGDGYGAGEFGHVSMSSSWAWR